MANKSFYALGRMKQGKMNKTEEAYSVYLEAQKQSRNVLWYSFEGIKFRLADNTYYTPDFSVMRPDGMIEIHEVKSWWVGDAKTKIKIASDMYPFLFKAIYALPKNKGGGWREEEF